MGTGERILGLWYSQVRVQPVLQRITDKINSIHLLDHCGVELIYYYGGMLSRFLHHFRDIMIKIDDLSYPSTWLRWRCLPVLENAQSEH